MDDDPQTLRSVCCVLAEVGLAPSVTGDSESLGRVSEETRPHFVLLDLMLPGGDGYIVESFSSPEPPAKIQAVLRR